VSNRAGLDTYYSLFLKTMRGHGTPPHSVSFFTRLYDLLGDDDRIWIYLAFADDTPINGIGVLRDSEQAYYWTGASDHEYRDLNGGSPLLWTAIQDATDAGCRGLDLCRAQEGSGVYIYNSALYVEAGA
jgi:lipid II:glycine glycyltransferase (peptidoglycan interpeptide bridge formation enzyme)